MADPDRLKLYRYVTAPEADDYLAIMAMFTDALLAEWSPQDVADRGLVLPVETIAVRCRYLTAAMERAGRAVHEEAMIDLLVSDLVDGIPW